MAIPRRRWKTTHEVTRYNTAPTCSVGSVIEASAAARAASSRAVVLNGCRRRYIPCDTVPLWVRQGDYLHGGASLSSERFSITPRLTRSEKAWCGNIPRGLASSRSRRIARRMCLRRVNIFIQHARARPRTLP